MGAHFPARLLTFRGAALAFWLGCVVFLLVPAHGSRARPNPFHNGGGLPQPLHGHVL